MRTISNKRSRQQRKEKNLAKKIELGGIEHEGVEVAISAGASDHRRRSTLCTKMEVKNSNQTDYSIQANTKVNHRAVEEEGALGEGG